GFSLKLGRDLELRNRNNIFLLDKSGSICCYESTLEKSGFLDRPLCWGRPSLIGVAAAPAQEKQSSGDTLHYWAAICCVSIADSTAVCCIFVADPAAVRLLLIPCFRPRFSPVIRRKTKRLQRAEVSDRSFSVRTAKRGAASGPRCPPRSGGTALAFSCFCHATSTRAAFTMAGCAPLRGSAMRAVAHVLFLAALLAATPVFAQQEPPARVGRVAFVFGELGFHEKGEAAWSKASLNYPVAAGGSFWTDPKSRAELRIGSRSVAMSGNTQLDIAKLDQQVMQLAVPQGR